MGKMKISKMGSSNKLVHVCDVCTVCSLIYMLAGDSELFLLFGFWISFCSGVVRCSFGLPPGCWSVPFKYGQCSKSDPVFWHPRHSSATTWTNLFIIFVLPPLLFDWSCLYLLIAIGSFTLLVSSWSDDGSVCKNLPPLFTPFEWMDFCLGMAVVVPA